ncbi:MAG: hypothetical protein ABJE95_30640 [Byssovorax sp.]
MRSAGSALLLCGALLGCERGAAEAASDPGNPAARAREASAQLRSLGAGRFEVDDFQVVTETRYTFRDDYEYPTRILALSFKARVHATHEIELHGADALMKRKGEPDLSLPDLERDVALLNVLGDRAIHAGEQRTVEAAAAFDLLEPGYRFRLFDRSWAGSP